MTKNRLAWVAILAGGLTASGCTSGGNGDGGNGGVAGNGGNGGSCEPVAERCESAASNPIEPCCSLEAPPTQENACDGTESLENPTRCEPTGESVTHRLTVFALNEECNAGFDLDGCDGKSCATGAFVEKTEGIGGVDNGLAASGPFIESIGEDLDAVQQAFSDSMCGLTDDGNQSTCDGGTNDGEACTVDTDCGGIGTCDDADNDCLMMIPAIDIELDVDANANQDCANVTLRSGDTSSSAILNLGEATSSETVCASGRLGSVPVVIQGKEATLTNAAVRMTVSADGFSDGLLGVTADEATARTIAETLPDPASQLVGELFDINDDLSGDPTTKCNALSLTMSIGGVAVP